MKSKYSIKDLILCWKRLKIKKGDVVYVAGNLFTLGEYYKTNNILKDYYTTLLLAIGKNGTLVFPTHSWSMKNKKKVFDLKKTPSECGVLSEYLRKKKTHLDNFTRYPQYQQLVEMQNF